MLDWISAVIGVAGTALGAGVGYRGALAIHKQTQRAARASEVRGALADYLGHLYVAVAELRELPASTEPGSLGKFLDKLRGESAAYVTRRRMEFQVTGNR